MAKMEGVNFAIAPPGKIGHNVVSSFEFRVSSFEFRVSSFEFRVSSWAILSFFLIPNSSLFSRECGHEETSYLVGMLSAGAVVAAALDGASNGAACGRVPQIR